MDFGAQTHHQYCDWRTQSCATTRKFYDGFVVEPIGGVGVGALVGCVDAGMPDGFVLGGVLGAVLGAVFGAVLGAVFEVELGVVAGVALGVFAGVVLVDEPTEGAADVGVEVEALGAGAAVDLALGVVGAPEAGFAALSPLAGIVNLVPTTSTAASSPMTFLLAS